MLKFKCVNFSCQEELRAENGSEVVICPKCGTENYSSLYTQRPYGSSPSDFSNLEYDLPSLDNTSGPSVIGNSPVYFPPPADQSPVPIVEQPVSHLPIQKDSLPIIEVSPFPDPPRPNNKVSGEESPFVPPSAPNSPPPIYDSTEIRERKKQQVKLPDQEAYLQTLDGMQRFAIKEGKNVIGREDGCHIVLHDSAVSRRHCVIEAIKENSSDWRYIIYDIGHLESNASANGVFINTRSQRLGSEERIELGHNTGLKLGYIYLVFRITQL